MKSSGNISGDSPSHPVICDRGDELSVCVVIGRGPSVSVRWMFPFPFLTVCADGQKQAPYGRIPWSDSPPSFPFHTGK